MKKSASHQRIDSVGDAIRWATIAIIIYAIKRTIL